MKISNLRLAAFFCLLLASSAFSQSQLLKKTTTKTDKLPFGAGGAVTIIGSPTGSVTVRPAKTNELSVTAEIEVQAANEADLAKLSEVTGFILDESLGRVSIVSVGSNNFPGGKKADRKALKKLANLPFRIDYTVEVPRYCDLTINGGKGDIKIEGVEGAISFKVLEGNANIDLIGGSLSATIGKGNAALSMPDRNWRGSVIDLAIASGDMTVDLPVLLSAELEVSILRTGKIDNQLTGLQPLQRKVTFTDRQISAKAGNGGVAMKFSVGDGNILLRPIVKN